MYERLGADWDRISDTVELLNKGYDAETACKEVEKKITLTLADKNEIDAQVKFKMNEFMTWLRNSANLEKRYSYNPELSIQKIKELYESSLLKKHILGALEKEINMITPYDNLYVEQRRKLKNEVIKQIEWIYLSNTRGRIKGIDLFIRLIVSQIERML